MVNFKPISLNVLCTSKMLREKIIEKFLSFIFNIPESEEMTQTVVSCFEDGRHTEGIM